MHDRTLSRSLILGFLILSCFPVDGSYRRNIEIAGMLGMSASSTHRYVSTLLALGLLERHPSTRRYRLTRERPCMPAASKARAGQQREVAPPIAQCWSTVLVGLSRSSPPFRVPSQDRRMLAGDMPRCASAPRTK
jgi:hypothetical protein